MVLGLQQNWVEGIESSHIPPLPTPCTPGTVSIIVSIPTSAAHVLWLMNLHRYIISSSSLVFALDVVHSMNMEKCIRTCIYHDSITQNSFSVLKPSVLCLFILPSPSKLNFWHCNRGFLTNCIWGYSSVTSLHRTCFINCGELFFWRNYFIYCETNLKFDITMHYIKRKTP